jgi:hypothetical protein
MHKTMPRTVYNPKFPDYYPKFVGYNPEFVGDDLEFSDNCTGRVFRFFKDDETK